MDIARRTAATLLVETELGAPKPDRAAALREWTRRANTWDELAGVLDEVQAAYDAGEITCEEVDSLAGCATDRSHEIPEHAEPGHGHLSALLARRPVVRVRSRLLGEVVVWVADEVEVPEDTCEVVYREAELRCVADRSPEKVRAIHAAKVAFSGELIE